MPFFLANIKSNQSDLDQISIINESFITSERHIIFYDEFENDAKMKYQDLSKLCSLQRQQKNGLINILIIIVTGIDLEPKVFVYSDDITVTTETYQVHYTDFKTCVV